MEKKDSTKRLDLEHLLNASARKRFPSPVFAADHQTAESLYETGLMEKRTMRYFDEACLTPVKPLSPSEIQALRKREDVSQSVFAKYLGLSVTLISQWERGEKKPQGASLKLLTLVKKNGLDFVA